MQSSSQVSSSQSSASSSTQSNTQSSTQSSSLTTSNSQGERQSLTIDDAYYPGPDLSQLWTIMDGPYPIWLTYTVYQPLVDPYATSEYGQGQIQYLPDLAVNWTVSPNNTIYSFNLRKGVTFSNGDAFNSYEVWAWMYGIYYLEANSSNWFQSYSIFNMSKVNFGPSTLALLKTANLSNPSQQVISLMSNTSWPIYVNGADQIVYHLDVAFPWFLNILVVNAGMMADVQYILNNGGFGTPAQLNSYFGTHPIPGTGPYMVTSVAVNENVQFAQNPTYWGRNLSQSAIAGNPYLDPGHVKNVIINYRPDDVSRYTDLSTGAAPISAIITQNWPLIQANPSTYGYVTMPSFSGLIFALAFNSHLYPTNVTDVRQAIVHAINYTNLNSTAFFGELSPFVGPEYPAVPQFYDLGNYTPYNYNLTLAKQYLNAANQSGQLKGPLTVSYNVANGCATCVNVAQIVQTDLAQIGINVQISVVSSAQIYAYNCAYTCEVQNAAKIPNIGVMGGTISYAPGSLSPIDNWELWLSNQSLSNDWAVYANPVVQACINSFTNGSSISQMTNLCTTAQGQIYKDAPYDWIGVERLFWASGSVAYLKSVISGFYMDPVWGGGGATTPIFNTVTFVNSP